MESEHKLPSDAAGELDESVGHLSVVLAHRLRGLVASIEGFTDLLNDTLVEPDQRELAMKILEGTARIESILADLQLYGESLSPVMLPVGVEEVLRDVLVPLSDGDRDRVEVDVEPDVSAKLILADPFLIRQALLILTHNALDAERKTSRVRIAARSEKKTVRFEVWNGGAIDLPNADDVVFTPFFTTKAQNLGVGLAIARRIIRLHDADIALISNDAEDGTCFAFPIHLSENGQI